MYVVVSVPLRGLWFLSNKKNHSANALTSPSFRPLAGIMVLIDKQFLLNGVLPLVVSVPLRGLWFLSEQRG